MKDNSKKFPLFIFIIISEQFQKKCGCFACYYYDNCKFISDNYI